MARSTIIKVKNESGSVIPKNTAVYFVGYDDDFNNPASTIGVSTNTDATTMPAIGITLEDIESGDRGTVRTNGVVGGIDTLGQEPNGPVYVGSNGGLVFDDPLDKNNNLISQQIGTISRVDFDDGQIFIFPLEIREKIEHDDLKDVRDDQHHNRLHAVTHRDGGSDELSHNSLSGRDIDNAHSQYVLTDGTRDIVGNQSILGSLDAANTVSADNGIIITKIAVAPSSPVDGQLFYYGAADGLFHYDDGRSAWLGELEAEGAGTSSNIAGGSASYLRRFNGVLMSATSGIYIPYDIRITGVSMVWTNSGGTPPGSGSEIRFKRNGTTVGTHSFSGGTTTSDITLNVAFSSGGIMAFEVSVAGSSGVNDMDSVQLRCWFRRKI